MTPPARRREPARPARGPLLIAGAGIGGLAAALALARQGHAVTVLEQRARPEEAGAGIQLSPNACHVLTRLGLAHSLARAAAEPERLAIRRGETGALLCEMPLGETMRKRFGAPYLVIHRADLQELLLDQARAEPGIRLVFGRRVGAIETDVDGVRLTAEMANGTETYEGAALIGADGLWSRVATALGEAPAPRFFGYAAWRGLVPAAQAPAAFRACETGLWIGRAGHVVHYPLRQGALINVVAVARSATATTDWSQSGDIDACWNIFGAWAAELTALLRLVPNWQVWSLYDRPVRPVWGRGCVTLLGDAAHPVLPFLAQGGALAIEDGAELSARLAATPDIPAALRAYEALRRPRAARVQQAARLNGRVYHLGGPAALARDLALGALGGARLLERYDWLYRWRPAREYAAAGLAAPAALGP